MRRRKQRAAAKPACPNGSRRCMMAASRGSAMDLGFTSEELAFRDELRAFIRDQLPDDIRERPGRRRNTRTYLRSRRECGIGSFLSGPAPLIEKIKFASDSPLEAAVTSEPVSDLKIPC